MARALRLGLYQGWLICGVLLIASLALGWSGSARGIIAVVWCGLMLGVSIDGMLRFPLISRRGR